MAKSTDELVASSHIQFSFINRECSWMTLFCEAADNSFDPDGGGASGVKFIIRKDSIEIDDNGQGIDDPNRLGRLGDSKSFFHAGNIGQFGAGIKSWYCKARKLRVRSVHKGILRLHTFDMTPVLAAFAEKKERVPWLIPYRDVGRPVHPGMPSGCNLLLQDFRAEAGTIIAPAIITEMQRTHWPALKAGKRITVEDKRRKGLPPVTIEPLAPPSWSDKHEFESVVNGRRYKATVGILSDHVGAYSGLFCGYIHRNIIIARTIPGRTLPPRIHGQIELSEDWRHCLSLYKDDIIVDKDALLCDIEKNARQIFELADNLAEDIRLEKVAFEIQGIASDALRNAASDEIIKKPRSDGGGGKDNPDPKPDPAVDPKPRKKPEDEDTKVKRRDEVNARRVSGLQVKWQPLGNDCLTKVQLHDKMLAVFFNRDCPKLEALSRQPKYPGLFLMIGDALAIHSVEMPIGEIEDRFGGMLGSAEGADSRARIMEAIRVWWGFIAEEKEREVAA